MQKLDLERLLRYQQKTQLLKEQATDLANQLIIEFDIHDGYQLAPFLKVGCSLDNYTAIRVWAEQWLKAHYSPFNDMDGVDTLVQDESVYYELKNAFFARFPETAMAG